jgi:hypothetical protein
LRAFTDMGLSFKRVAVSASPGARRRGRAPAPG